MIGSSTLALGDTHSPSSVTIVGGGIAGLLLAEHLSRRFAAATITVRESSSRFGGLIGSRVEPWGQTDSAAHSLLVTPTIRPWFDAIGVSLDPCRSSARARWVWRGGRARRAPLSVLALTELVGAGARWWSTRALPVEPEMSMAVWGEQRLGSAATDYLLNPMLRGVYAARPAELLASSVLPERWRTPDRARGRRDKPAHMAIRGGTEALIQALVRALEQRPRVRLMTRSPVSPSELGNTLPTPSAAHWLAICTDATQAALLTERLDSSLASALSAISYAPLVSISLGIRRSCLARPPRGVGLLIPECESLREESTAGFSAVLGVLFNSSAFASRESIDPDLLNLTVMLGGTGAPEVLALSDEALLAQALTAVRALGGVRIGRSVRELCVGSRIYRWPRAIPLYDRSRARAQAALEDAAHRHPGWLWFGNYSGDVSIRGMIERLVQESLRTQTSHLPQRA